MPYPVDRHCPWVSSASAERMVAGQMEQFRRATTAELTDAHTQLPVAEGAVVARALERLVESYGPLADGTCEPATAGLTGATPWSNWPRPSWPTTPTPTGPEWWSRWGLRR